MTRLKRSLRTTPRLVCWWIAASCSLLSLWQCSSGRTLPGNEQATGGGGPSSDPSPSPGSGSNPNTVPNPMPDPVPDPNDSKPPSDNPNTMSSDPNGFFGAPRCSAKTFVVCDSFETGAKGSVPDPKIWILSVNPPGNAKVSLTLDTSRAARGKQSLHVQAPNNGYIQALLATTKGFPAPQNNFFGRAFVYFEGEVPTPHFTTFVASGNLPGSSTPTFVRYGAQFGTLMANYFGSDAFQHSKTNWPHDRWACFEWQYDGAHNTQKLWLDGKSIDDMTVNGHSTDCCPSTVWTAPPYSQFALGWEIYSQAQPGGSMFNVWYDEVALDTERIGCTL